MLAPLLESSEDKLLSLAEVAVLLGVHYETARRWAKDGTLPVMRLGGVRRVAQSDLTRVMRQPRGI